MHMDMIGDQKKKEFEALFVCLFVFLLVFFFSKVSKQFTYSDIKKGLMVIS